MVEFFTDGGFAMYPILVLGLLLLAGSIAYAIDTEPVRVRLTAVLSLLLFAFSIEGLVIDAAAVFQAVAAQRFQGSPQLILLEGLKESTRPLILGLTFWSLALVFVSIGVYRAGSRELQAARAG